jgi:hypothetical protein
MEILYIYILFMQINFYWLQYIPLLGCDVGLVSEVLIQIFFVVWYTLRQSGTCSSEKKGVCKDLRMLQ